MKTRLILAACTLAALLALPVHAQEMLTPSTQPDRSWAQTRQRVAELTRRSIELLEQQKPEEARTVLQEALALNPNDPGNLYNMACLLAITGHADQSMDYLVRSAQAGFTDFVHIERDPDLASLRNRADYEQFVAQKDQFQRMAAEKTVETMQRMLGPGYTYEIDDVDKFVFATHTDAQTVEALKASLLAQAHSQWQQLFENKPQQYITIVVPSPVDFRRIIRVPGVEGFYNPALHTLIAQGLGFVTTHEFTHALHAADIEPLAQVHPIWITEGLAVLFESSQYHGTVLTPQDGFRLPFLLTAARTGRLIPLARLLAMPRVLFVRPQTATLAYAESGYLMLYLYEKGLLRKFYDTFKHDFGQDGTGRLALETVTGQKLDDIETAWRHWLSQRKPPPMSSGPDGPFLGVRFDQTVDGVRADIIIPGSPAAIAGLKPGDVVIGVGPLDVRDVETLLPLLATHHPGDQITLKIRRQKEYLDIPVTLTRRGGPSTRN